MVRKKKGGRPVGSATRRYGLTGNDRRRRRRLAKYAERVTGLERAIIRDRMLAETPVTLIGVAARYGKSRSLAAKVENRLFETVLAA